MSDSKPTIEDVRAEFSHMQISDDLLMDPWFHVGVIGSYLPEGHRARLSLAVIEGALRDLSDLRLKAVA